MDDCSVNREENEIRTILEMSGLLAEAFRSTGQERAMALRQVRRLLNAHYPIDQLPPETSSTLAKSLLPLSSTTKLASQCLLQIVSNSSPSTLAQQSSSIIHPVLAALSSAAHQSVPRNDRLVTITYLFRISSTLITKVGTVVLINLSDQVDCIRNCFQPPVAAHALQHHERILISSQPVMAQDHPASSSKSRDPHSDSEAKSDSDAGVSSQTSKQAIQCRLDALSYLRTIAESDAKALYPFWSRLLPGREYRGHQPYTLLSIIERDPHLVVRVRACGVVNRMLDGAASYMAIAEEDNTRMSYISLSAQIAAITIELHQRLGYILKGSVISSDLTGAILELCETVIKNSAYPRISVPILGPLLDSIIRGPINSNDPAISSKARASLMSIFQHLSGSKKSIPISPSADQLMSIGCVQLGCEAHRASFMSWCELLKNVIGFISFDQLMVNRFMKLRSLFDNIPADEQETGAQLSLLGSIATVFPGPEFDSMYLRWVKSRLRQEGLDSVGVVMASHCERIKANVANGLRWELVDSLDDVRAIRLVGIIVSMKLISDPLEWVTKAALHILAGLESFKPDQVEQHMMSTRSWSMANCVEALQDLVHGQTNYSTTFDYGVWLRFVKISQVMLLSANSTIAAKTNSVRICGTALCVIHSVGARVGLDDAAIEEAIEIICSALMSGVPKLQWNAATTLRQLLTFLTTDSDQADPQPMRLEETICKQLCQTLESSNSFKVRIQVCLALQVVHHRPAKLSESIKQLLDKLLEFSRTGLIPTKEQDHADRLRQELVKLL